MPRPSSRRAQPLSRTQVIAAALQLADAQGIEALSMRKLADTLGVKAMSLYNHVKNKDDLLDAIVDHVVAEMALPSLEQPWKDAMRERALSTHQILLHHPWATLPLVSRVNVGPAMLHRLEATLACLQAAGFSLPLADHAWNAMDSHIYGFTLQALNFPFESEDYATAAADYVEMIPAETYPTLNQLTQLVMHRQYDGLHDFEFGLSLVLDGLETLLLRQ
ncbi:MAG: TetR/AcrR family transcriptional regulator C-terminal domain-containing protein [Cyanobacteria bacterium J06632_22]